MINISGLPKTQINSLGIGVFDGLHLGHRALLNHCDYLLSFHPHPDIVLKKETDLRLITTRRELRFLHPQSLFLTFNKAIASLSPYDFLNHIIKSRINPNHIVVGYDFRFGFKKMGTLDLLTSWAEEQGIKVTIIRPFTRDNIPVKSGVIRQYLRNDDFDQALDFLGHPYVIIGGVTKGEGRGRSLGFPTANIQPSALKLYPTNGVYGGHVILPSGKQKAIIYIGTKPTFNGETHTIEVHIPNYEGNLYHKRLTVLLDQKIRGEQTFASQDDLVQQIHRDLACL